MSPATLSALAMVSQVQQPLFRTVPSPSARELTDRNKTFVRYLIWVAHGEEPESHRPHTANQLAALAKGAVSRPTVLKWLQPDNGGDADL
ncbi:hypothetical protein [Streptomyces sp. NPDC001787]|uniref:hypothetical protein n=1 Tax=Streptomyces sp. NPDC001787 TaxID=3154523 RepID=UPI0033257E52